MFSFAVAGHAEVVRFLLEACKVNPVPKDRSDVQEVEHREDGRGSRITIYSRN